MVRYNKGTSDYNQFVIHLRLTRFQVKQESLQLSQSVLMCNQNEDCHKVFFTISEAKSL